MLIHGITVLLHQKTETDRDELNQPVYTDAVIEVDNVLVAPSTETEVNETVNLTGRKAVYTLGIPKGDTHEWTDTIVEFFGQKFRTIGMPIGGIEDMIPLDWNYKVRCEVYE